MRGKVSILQNQNQIFRITPAYAGKSAIFQINVLHFQDHPRLCGEKRTCAECRQPQLGSPPPMRGKVNEQLEDLAEDRITPAYAGKSIKIVWDVVTG